MTKHFDNRARQSLRLVQQIWEAIDSARSRRAGTISRNTWITEAILEKIARDDAKQDISGVGVGHRA